MFLLSVQRPPALAFLIAALAELATMASTEGTAGILNTVARLTGHFPSAAVVGVTPPPLAGESFSPGSTDVLA